MAYLFFLVWFFRMLNPGLSLPTSGPQCSTLTPSFTGLVYSGMPDASFVPGPGAPRFHALDDTHKAFAKLLNNAGAIVAVKSNGNAVETIIEFAGLPKDAWGCQLEVHFSAGFHQVHFLGEAPSSMQVCSTSQSVQELINNNHWALTWRTAPNCAAVHGRISGDELRKSAVQGEVHTILNSMACKERMAFRVSVPDEVPVGGSGFMPEEGAQSGWVMRYNC